MLREVFAEPFVWVIGTLLLISMLQRIRSRREQARSEKAAAQAAAARKFEEVFKISPKAQRDAVMAQVKTVVTAMNLKMRRDVLSDPDGHEARKRERDDAVNLAARFGFRLKSTEVRRARRSQVSTGARTQDPTAADSAA